MELTTSIVVFFEHNNKNEKTKLNFGNHDLSAIWDKLLEQQSK